MGSGSIHGAGIDLHHHVELELAAVMSGAILVLVLDLGGGVVEAHAADDHRAEAGNDALRIRDGCGRSRRQVTTTTTAGAEQRRRAK